MSGSAQAFAIRLCLGWDGANGLPDQDVVKATLDEFVGKCDSCTSNVIFLLLATLVPFLEAADKDGWRPALQGRLAELLDLIDIMAVDHE
jgi:hypothetical protein